MGVGLLLCVSELLLAPPQPVGQHLQLPEPSLQLPPHLLLLPLQAHLHLHRLPLRHLQLQAVLLRLETSLLHLHGHGLTSFSLKTPELLLG
ncbi:hypothetical protein INR49_019263 [Caranx melampygus]|nr:hypothetical protein INR49_019263 [Caranx melampygus]